jgi:hypothetical protein
MPVLPFKILTPNTYDPGEWEAVLTWALPRKPSVEFVDRLTRCTLEYLDCFSRRMPDERLRQERIDYLITLASVRLKQLTRMRRDAERIMK